MRFNLRSLAVDDSRLQDPQHRTIGQFVAEEVMAPLGLEGCGNFDIVLGPLSRVLEISALHCPRAVGHTVLGILALSGAAGTASVLIGACNPMCAIVSRQQAVHVWRPTRARQPGRAAVWHAADDGVGGAAVAAAGALPFRRRALCAILRLAAAGSCVLPHPASAAVVRGA